MYRFFFLLSFFRMLKVKRKKKQDQSLTLVIKKQKICIKLLFIHFSWTSFLFPSFSCLFSSFSFLIHFLHVIFPSFSFCAANCFLFLFTFSFPSFFHLFTRFFFIHLFFKPSVQKHFANDRFILESTVFSSEDHKWTTDVQMFRWHFYSVTNSKIQICN